MFASSFRLLHPASGLSLFSSPAFEPLFLSQTPLPQSSAEVSEIWKSGFKFQVLKNEKIQHDMGTGKLISELNSKCQTLCLHPSCLFLSEYPFKMFGTKCTKLKLASKNTLHILSQQEPSLLCSNLAYFFGPCDPWG